MVDLSAAEFRALRAVDMGRAIRVYREDGNVIHCIGASLAILHSLAKRGFIQDGKDTGKTGLVITSQLELSKKGKEAFERAR